MKLTVIILMISSLTISRCSSQEPVKFTHDKSVLDFYGQYSSFTDPGDYVYLYENLPDSLSELCTLIKSQFIHPYAELPKYSDIIPKERWNEMVKYNTVQPILEGLISYDSRGLVNDRKPKDRLILGCRDYAVLLASILKHRGIPARIRAGHATYLIPDFHTSHVICEVWNEHEHRWILVDPGTNMIDFNRAKYDFSYDAWLELQQKEIDPNQYGIPGKYSGFASIVAKVCGDLAFILGKEYTVYQYPPLLGYALENDNQLTSDHIKILDKVSELMKSLDAENLSELQEIYQNTPDLQLTRSFVSKEKKAEEVAKETDPKTIEQNIEFINVPAGTFIMGSPTTEEGRQKDEIQHEVTVSSFKMSKYPITVEQYNSFCEATGRKQPWYGPNRYDKLPVTQVTWYDAKAFSEWLGCRLPTEAEFEYATRANTTTPYYTGISLASDQANYNCKEFDIKGGKSEKGKKPLPVGSFPPNAFGLYDMHGNMLEWTKDWYGEYIIEDTLNPKGPETGTKKVARGGGWFEPASASRSACRGGGIPPGNRGAGISFRIVKDK